MFRDEPKTFLYDYAPPRETTLSELRENFAAMLGSLTADDIVCEIVECRPQALGDDAAWTASLMHVVLPLASGTLDLTYRATDIWRKIDGRWLTVHEHASFPVDPSSGQADLRSAR